MWHLDLSHGLKKQPPQLQFKELPPTSNLELTFNFQNAPEETWGHFVHYATSGRQRYSEK